MTGVQRCRTLLRLLALSREDRFLIPRKLPLKNLLRLKNAIKRSHMGVGVAWR